MNQSSSLNNSKDLTNEEVSPNRDQILERDKNTQEINETEYTIEGIQVKVNDVQFTSSNSLSLRIEDYT